MHSKAELAGEFSDDDESADASDDAPRPGSGLLRAPVATRADGDKLARFDPMQAYMREVQQHPLLTPDEEKPWPFATQKRATWKRPRRWSLPTSGCREDRLRVPARVSGT